MSKFAQDEIETFPVQTTTPTQAVEKATAQMGGEVNDDALRVVEKLTREQLTETVGGHKAWTDCSVQDLVARREEKDGGLEGWRVGWMDGRKDGWKEGRMEGRMDGWMDGRVEGWMDGRKEGRMEGRTGGRTGGRERRKEEEFDRNGTEEEERGMKKKEPRIRKEEA